MINALAPEGIRGSAPQVPHHPLATFRDDLDDLLARFFGSQGGFFAGRLFLFADVNETDTTVEVIVDVPGVEPDDLDIELTGNVLTVRGERQEPKHQKGQTCHRAERRKGGFSRSVMLPCAVASDTVAAEYRDGVLTISLSKGEEAPVRKIEVQRRIT